MSMNAETSGTVFQEVIRPFSAHVAAINADKARPPVSKCTPLSSQTQQGPSHVAEVASYTDNISAQPGRGPQQATPPAEQQRPYESKTASYTYSMSPWLEGDFYQGRPQVKQGSFSQRKEATAGEVAARSLGGISAQPGGNSQQDKPPANQSGPYKGTSAAAGGIAKLGQLSVRDAAAAAQPAGTNGDMTQQFAMTADLEPVQRSAGGSQDTPGPFQAHLGITGKQTGTIKLLHYHAPGSSHSVPDSTMCL